MDARVEARRATAGQRLVALLAVIVGILVIAWTSLLLTSEPIDAAQRQQVSAALGILNQRGFGREAFVLAHLTTYRSSDNWWNGYVGHSQAYAATNFPFEVLTLYPRFFQATMDDTERAVILLHEAQHLLGHGEEMALQYVWLARPRLGWTDERYGRSRVWRNTREWTQQTAPGLFVCGADGRSDCIP